MLTPSAPSRSAATAGTDNIGPDEARRLRVAIVSDAAPERNGVGAYYSDLAEHLKGVGARVEITSPRFHAGNWYGGLAVPLPGDPTQRFLFPSPALIRHRIERIAPTAVIVPTPGPFGMVGMHYAKRFGARLVVGFHTHFERLTELNNHWRLFGMAAQTYLTTCNRKLFHEADLVLANSPEMIDVARRMGARNPGLMGTPIPKHFLDAPARPLRPGIGKVLFAGRLAPEKNLGTVVDAAAALPALEFVIAGDGPLRGWIEAQAARLPNLTYVGWAKRRRILPLIDDADVLVLPSRVESFGTIALEAMARGRLVVVSAACGILSWDLLSRGLFQMRSDEPLSAALGRLCALDHALLERKAEIARTAAHELNERNLQHWLRVLLHGELRGLDQHTA
jgi:glycosyltransferase involved in cell wall biosynthesis